MIIAVITFNYQKEVNMPVSYLSEDVVYGILSVFEKRDSDNCEGLPGRVVEFTENEKDIDINQFSKEVVSIINESNPCVLLSTSDDSFILSLNSIELNCKMSIFYDDEYDGLGDVKKFIISPI
jgi:hypothetical protein